MHAHLLQFCISALALHLWHSFYISAIVACNEATTYLLSKEIIDNVCGDAYYLYSFLKQMNTAILNTEVTDF